jgi:hypothetical protein
MLSNLLCKNVIFRCSVSLEHWKINLIFLIVQLLHPSKQRVHPKIAFIEGLSKRLKLLKGLQTGVAIMDGATQCRSKRGLERCIRAAAKRTSDIFQHI